jgi:PhnB protein
MADQFIPEGSQTLTPYLVLDDCAGAIEFYRDVFGAEEMFRMDGPDGKVGHASLKFGDSQVMLSDPFPQGPYEPPRGRAATGGLYLYVEDVDAVFRRAVDAGAKAEQELQDMFWGDRWCQLTDPFGAVWELATHVEDVSAEDMAERMKEMMPAS